MRLDLLLGSRVELAIKNGSPARRRELLRQVTDLFVVGATQCNEEHIAVFDHVIARLAVDIETSARALLATRLAPIPNAPPGVIRTLAFDDSIEVAAPVLSLSERLDDATLAQAAADKSQEHLLAISRRARLAEVVTDVLVERGNREVAKSAAENRGAKFSGQGLSKLIARAAGDDDLTTSLGSRSDIPTKLFLVLLEKASESVRLKLEALHPQRTQEVRHIVAEVVSRIRAETLEDATSSPPTADPLGCPPMLDEQMLVTAARERNIEAVASSLARMGNADADDVKSAILNGMSEVIILLTRALEIEWSTVEAILLMNSGAGPSPVKLKQLQNGFDRLKPSTAREIVRFQQARATLAGTQSRH
jgi:hypothetical protein